MTAKPFLKWAGGKRWLIEKREFQVPAFQGRYIEPFLGGGAVFFHLAPSNALLSDLNPKLIDTYKAIKEDWSSVWQLLLQHQEKHCKTHYYEERAREWNNPVNRAAQFLYLNRACWNGLYRENLAGRFNVPIGTKSTITFNDDDFSAVAAVLNNARLETCDFEETLETAVADDFVFVDPPYTTAHNFNGFVKYNQNIFKWEDQVRLRDAVLSARRRGATIIMTNANHESVVDLYSDIADTISVERYTVISGNNKGRSLTQEALIFLS